jgi:hypothetical protein
MQQNQGSCANDRILTCMAYDEWEQEYHLTHGGWLRGSFFFGGTLARKIPTPGDRVLTLIRESARSKDALGLETNWRQSWMSKDCTQQQIDGLKQKFGHRPVEVGVPALRVADPVSSIPQP